MDRNPKTGGAMKARVFRALIAAALIVSALQALGAPAKW
jgi:hypothetical protein